MRAIVLMMLLFLLASCENDAEKPTFEIDGSASITEVDADNCEHSGPQSDGGIAFIFTCPQFSRSPDGNATVVVDDYRYENGEESYRVYATYGASGREMEIAGLNDALPFTLFWSPKPGRFAVEHYRGSGLATVKVFEITADEVLEQVSFNAPALAAYAANIPCLTNLGGSSNRGRIQGWSPDGRYLAWTMMTRLDACMEPDEYGSVPPEKQVSPVSVISNLNTGEVVANSVRVLDWEDLSMPTDGPYAQIIRVDE